MLPPLFPDACLQRVLRYFCCCSCCYCCCCCCYRMYFLYIFVIVITYGNSNCNNSNSTLTLKCAGLLKQHTAELRRADSQQRVVGQIAARNALRDERTARMRSQRAVAELATREASVLSHRASAGYVYRRQLYRLALKLQRERGWLENGTEASEAYARLRGSDRRQAASENYYREQIALLEEKIATAQMDRATRERAQRQLLRSVEADVYEQQVANVKAIQRELEALDNTDFDYDVERGASAMHSLNRHAATARRHAWQGRRR
mmetsp:Transcript_24441/g.56581  ORF Transcript_24441/g.56581 Transcript_24441/m.56581 type:complete len:263 (+) Transcript_24441:68-856(+)